MVQALLDIFKKKSNSFYYEGTILINMEGTRPLRGQPYPTL